ncbi:MAG: permease [Pirellulaceae bacterium]
MLNGIWETLVGFWDTLCELAPWLLLGMAISGAMHVLLPVGFIKRNLQGRRGVVNAVFWGIPLPLCSCGVIPTGIGLKKDGASDGASVGFLISTPQTGVDSILVAASFLGWPFALFKVVAALVTGLIGGWIADWSTSPKKGVQRNESGQLNVLTGDNEPVVSDSKAKLSFGQGLLAGWNHALEIVSSIWGWLVFGVLISVVITEWIPASWIEALKSLGPFGAMLAVLLISTPSLCLCNGFGTDRRRDGCSRNAIVSCTCISDRGPGNERNNHGCDRRQVWTPDIVRLPINNHLR